LTAIVDVYFVRVGPSFTWLYNACSVGNIPRSFCLPG